MTTNIKYISIAVLAVLIIGLGSFYIGKKSQITNEGNATSTINTSTTTVTPSGTTNTTTKTPVTNTGSKTTNLTSGNTTGFYSYNNSEYNFSIKYPAYVKSSNVFTTFHEIGNNWRLYASSANQGKSLEEFSIYSIDQGVFSTGKQVYPLYFTAEVRIGVSPNVKECYATDAGYTNQQATNVTINGITFKKFSTQDSAMMKYVQAESYRTIHNNNCFVLEQIKNGTNYRDEKMALGTADSTLNNYYNTGETIIKTFRFTK